jgi:hypothetical protein
MKYTLLVLAFAAPTHAAQLTINQLFQLEQQNSILAQAYTAGVLDTSRGIWWCNHQDPDPKLVVRAAIKYAVKNNIDPNHSADLAIVPLMQELAPCGKSNL